MNSKFKKVLVTATVSLSIVAIAPMAHAKANTSSGCSLLAPDQAQKVLGQPFNAPQDIPLIPPFGDKWGSHCIYRSQKDANVVIDFFVYVTASPAQAKQWFDMGAGVAKKSESKPTMGDSAYIDRSDRSLHVLKGNVLYWILIPRANEKLVEDLAASVAARI